MLQSNAGLMPGGQHDRNSISEFPRRNWPLRNFTVIDHLFTRKVPPAVLNVFMGTASHRKDGA
jgi:hypothetical protein